MVDCLSLRIPGRPASRLGTIVLLGLSAWLDLRPSLTEGAESHPTTISFARDVQPLLSRHCYRCHGPDATERKGDLRLDIRETAVESAILPGKPSESELIRRLRSDDPEERMPPPEAKSAMKPAEVELLAHWIQAGAPYDQHWSFVPPQRPPFPEVTVPANDPSWNKHPIDRFVWRTLVEHGQRPSPQADRATLVRRVYLDLIGLPPTPEQADAFLRDPRSDAWDRLVDSLLDSQHYGERWAVPWLDLARYADTNGYEKDRERSVWLYRDWVIRALNQDLPFDQFSIEQLAGDMLPQASQAQRIATGFHRNTMLNEEGGIDPLEFRFHAMVDRVATTGLVWLGLTTGCAQCHTHKYDPISHTEYYQLMALLNNADEPDLVVSDAEIQHRRDQMNQEIRREEETLAATIGDQSFEAWVKLARQQALHWTVLRPTSMVTNSPRLELLEDGSILSTGDITKRDLFTLEIPLDAHPIPRDQPITALRLEAIPDDRLPAGGPGRTYYEGSKGDFFLSELKVLSSEKDQPIRFLAGKTSYGKIAVGSGTANADNLFDGDGSTGWSVAGREGEAHAVVLLPVEPLSPKGGLQLQLLFERHFAASLGRFRLSVTTDPVTDAWFRDETKAILPSDVESLLLQEPATPSEGMPTNSQAGWTPQQRARLLSYYLSVSPEFAETRKPIEALRQQLPKLPTTLVLQERPDDHPRVTHRHHRGEYLSPREHVHPGIPAILQQPTGKEPRNRLEFARWMVSRENPLVARVIVNRTWSAFFGAGLVRTAGDYGVQSAPPTHPELLDWLACEWMDEGWSMKRLHRLIVTSATYRQSSTPPPNDQDPENRLWGRGPRHRLDAEFVRDTLLHSSGLLSTKMYGPGVYPPQPVGVSELAYGNPSWKVSSGVDRYRRSVYTFRKRTAPFAAFGVFDAPSAESCVARRDRSNTPLQALTLLNDEMYVEMARALAKRVMQTNGTADQRISLMFRHLLTREPTDQERGALLAYYETQRVRIVQGELDPYLLTGQAKDVAVEPADVIHDWGAWSMVARIVMNLDETITKR